MRLGFMYKSVIARNKLLIAPDAALYHFGVLTPNVQQEKIWKRGGIALTRAKKPNRSSVK